MSSLEAAKKIIANSGNSFHSRVARWLQEHEWHVLISPYYMDQTQNKAREIDLIAERIVPIRDLTDRRVGDVVIRMYIECKFISAHSVFWFTLKDRESAEKLVCRSGNFRSNNTRTSEHHYLSTCDTVAKVFATGDKSQEQEPIYKALSQVLNAYVSMQNRPPIISALRESNRGACVRLNYPVVVCSEFTKLFRTDFFNDSEPEQIRDNFQLEVQYAYTDSSNSSRNDHFLIDFVSFDQLDGFCNKLIRNGEISADLFEQ
jgi:hypothetical protein